MMKVEFKTMIDEYRASDSRVSYTVIRARNFIPWDEALRLRARYEKLLMESQL